MGGGGHIQVLFVGKELRGLIFGVGGGGLYALHWGRGVLELYGALVAVLW